MLMYVQIRLAVCKIHLALPRQALCFLHSRHSTAMKEDGGGTWGESKLKFILLSFPLS